MQSIILRISELLFLTLGIVYRYFAEYLHTILDFLPLTLHIFSTIIVHSFSIQILLPPWSMELWYDYTDPVPSIARQAHFWYLKSS